MFIMYFCAMFHSRVHATFWLGMEQCSNRHRNLVPDESGACRFARHTYQKMESVYGAGFWRVCHGYKFWSQGLSNNLGQQCINRII